MSIALKDVPYSQLIEGDLIVSCRSGLDKPRTHWHPGIRFCSEGLEFVPHYRKTQFFDVIRDTPIYNQWGKAEL